MYGGPGMGMGMGGFQGGGYGGMPMSPSQLTASALTLLAYANLFRTEVESRRGVGAGT